MSIKIVASIFFVILFSCFTNGCRTNSSQEGTTRGKEFENSTINNNERVLSYSDGVYEVQDKPDYEGYYCKAVLTVEDGKITKVDWKIFDSNNREFDDSYEEIFAGNKAYQYQCRGDMKGVKEYGANLIETQDIDEVDTISGATWSHSKFVAILKMAVEKARK